MKPLRVGRLFQSWRGLIGVAAVAPLAVGPSGDFSDSSATRFAIAAGSGSYAVITRGCEGEVLSGYKRDFHDAAATVQHEFRGPLVLGVRAQQISGPPNVAGTGLEQVLWNPHVALEWRSFGIGGGWVTPNGANQEYSGLDQLDILPVSAHLRFGDLRRTYLSIQAMEDEPCYSSGGTFVVGIGARASSAVHLWFGVGGVTPYDGVGLLARTDIQVTPGLQASIGGRLGSSEGVSENAIRAGLSYTWTHRRYESRSEPRSFGPDSSRPQQAH